MYRKVSFAGGLHHFPRSGHGVGRVREPAQHIVTAILYENTVVADDTAAQRVQKTSDRRKRGLVAKTFYKQRRRLGYPRGQSRSVQPGGFIQLQPATAVASAGVVSLHYHDSRLELSSGVSAAWVAELLRALA